MKTVSVPITDEVFYVLKKDVSIIQSDMLNLVDTIMEGLN